MTRGHDFELVDKLVDVMKRPHAETRSKLADQDQVDGVSVGDAVWGYSRGQWRRGVVSKEIGRAHV